jgi:two-component system sensor histidine kinase KdpD
LVAAGALAAMAPEPDLGRGSAAMLLLFCVLVGAMTSGIGPALAAAVLAALSYNLFFLEPQYTLAIAAPADVMTFAMFFAVAIATGWLAGRSRDTARQLAASAGATARLLEASRALAQASTPDEAARALAHHAAATGGRAVVLFEGHNGLRLAGGPPALTALDPGSLEAATRAWKNLAGTAQIDRAGAWTFHVLKGLQGRVGVIGLSNPAQTDSRDDRDLMAALMEQSGVVIERAQLAAAAGEARALKDADKLRTALLNAVSHDFRTPLASILGASTTLSDYGQALGAPVRRDLLRSIQQDAQQLNRHIGALLDMGRLEGGALHPKQEWTDVREIIGSATRRLRSELAGHRIERDFAVDLSLVKADPTLLEQSILNVLQNAATYAPPGSTIRIGAHEDHRHVVISIDDEGPGIPEADQGRVFDRFHRLAATGASSSGLGLGLSITRGFVEAMGGRIAVASPLRTAGGARFAISLRKVAETPRGLL